VCPSGIFQVLLKLVGFFTERREAVLSQQEQEGRPGYPGQLGCQARAEPSQLVEFDREKQASFGLELVRFPLQGLENLRRIGDVQVHGRHAFSKGNTASIDSTEENTMPEIVIQLDDEIAERLRQASEKDGISPSAWVKQAIRLRLQNKLPARFFAVLGTWEDSRSTEEILRDLRISG